MPCDAQVPPLLEAEAFVVRRGDAFAVELPALQLAAGGVVALVGPPGSGKSTLLLGLCGQLEAAATATGAVRWCGGPRPDPASAAWRRVLWSQCAVLPQEAMASLDPLQRLGPQLAALAGVPEAAVARALTDLGVEAAEALVRRFPHQISGGQAQRAWLAVAVLRAPRLVVADEPTAHLDAATRQQVVAHLRGLCAAGSALLLATHDLRLPEELGAAVFAAAGGRFVPGCMAPLAWPARPPAVDPSRPPVLEAQGLEVAFGAAPVLAGLDLELRPGEVLAVTGPSGVGKSTLLGVLAGRRRADRGAVRLAVPVRSVQLCGQDAWAGLTPGRTLQSLLDEVAADPGLVARLLQALGMPRQLLQRSAQRLSGGERRAAALLRALAVQPKVLLLDEPTAGLDRAAAAGLFAELLALQGEFGFALGFATHDDELAAAVAHRVLALRAGRWAA
jgi:peptide/nickel transport system ATP-binding protein